MNKWNADIFRGVLILDIQQRNYFVNKGYEITGKIIGQDIARTLQMMGGLGSVW